MSVLIIVMKLFSCTSYYAIRVFATRNTEPILMAVHTVNLVTQWELWNVRQDDISKLYRSFLRKRHGSLMSCQRLFFLFSSFLFLERAKLRAVMMEKGSMETISLESFCLEAISCSKCRFCLPAFSWIFLFVCFWFDELKIILTVFLF